MPSGNVTKCYSAMGYNVNSESSIKVYGTFRGDSGNYYIEPNNVTVSESSGVAVNADNLNTHFSGWKSPKNTNKYGFAGVTDLEETYPFLLPWETDFYGTWIPKGERKAEEG